MLLRLTLVGAGVTDAGEGFGWDRNPPVGALRTGAFCCWGDREFISESSSLISFRPSGAEEELTGADVGPSKLAIKSSSSEAEEGAEEPAAREAETMGAEEGAAEER